MKHLVFVIESLHLGGAEKSLVTLLQNLDYKKNKVDLIVFNKGGIFENSVPKGVSVIYKSMHSLSFTERVRFKLVKQFNLKKQHTAQLLWKIIQNKFEKVTKKYDVAIAYNQGFATYYVERYLSAKLKAAWLNTDYQKAGYDINFDYPIYKQYNSIIAVSPEAKAGLVAELQKIDRDLQVNIIKDISNKSSIRKRSKELKIVNFDNLKINIVTVGRLVKAKGLHLAVQCCRILKDNGYPVHWYVVGEGSERKYIENLIIINKLQNNFTLVGMTENPYPYMKDCDIYVQTSLFEGLGLTVIEASYLNKPIVSTNFPTVYGILKDSETGLIAEMNAESIAKKVELLITNENLKAKLVANLSTATNRDKETTLLQFEKLINSV